jgi:superfamily II DNA or RNA helicase
MKQFTGIFSKSKDWKSFSFQLEQLDNKDKGDIFELVTKEYLLSDPVYSTKLRSVWLLKDVPLKVREYLELPVTDQGIDLIAETKEGEYWAIQCKYHSDATHNVTWREISTFTGLAFGICKNISFGLLCTTGDRYTKVLSGQQRIGICAYDIWSGLQQDFFKRLITRDKSLPLVPFTPRAHQTRAIDRAKTHFSYGLNKRGKLIMPCGTGKSLTSFWINEALDANTTLIAVPSISLLRQTLYVWTREFTAKGMSAGLEWLCVCSDETVSDNSTDELESLPQDLGVPCTTEASAIAEWFRKTDGAKKRIIFTTYQSGRRIIDASKAAGITFDLGIFDEAHKTVGNQNSLFSLMLFDKNISIQRRLFMTATERRYIGKSDQIASMEDPLIYGETIDLLTFKAALKQVPKIICDYKILTLFITKAEVVEMILGNKFVKPDNGKWSAEVESEMLAALVAVKKAMQQYPIKHVVSFHSSIARAKAFKKNADIFTATLPQYGSLDTYHISGSDPSSVRQYTLNAFNDSNHSLVTNARCLTEGIDLPGIDCVVFADPKKSKVDIVQALGRALRPAPNKEFGYIVIPVLLDNEKDFEDIIEENTFSDLMLTLRALASNDERVIDEFRDISSGRTLDKHSILHDVISGNFLAQNIDIEEFTESVNLYCWDNLVKLAYKPFASARRSARKLGLHNEQEWRFYCENQLQGYPPKSSDLPDEPNEVYKKDWRGWDNWLGTGLKGTGAKYLKFDLARQIARSLLLESEQEWLELAKIGLPALVPKHPSTIYFREWEGWDNWLLWDNNGEYLEFNDAKEVARSLNINNKAGWADYVLTSVDLGGLPPRPDIYYKNQWRGWMDWLGSTPKQAEIAAVVREKIAISKNQRSFEEARKFARTLGLQDKHEWKMYCSHELVGYETKPTHIPRHPNVRWPGHWKGWNDWLGKGIKKMDRASRSDDIYMGYREARNFARSLGLQDQREWKLYTQNRIKTSKPIPASMPVNPKSAYLNYWVDWDDWLGKKRTASLKKGQVAQQQELPQDRYIPFNLARVTVRKLNLSGRIAWMQYANSDKMPVYIPRNPNVYYADWVDWDDWLGIKAKKPQE